MKFAIVIPSFCASSRFPGKPVIDIKGTSMIRQTWKCCGLAVLEDCICVTTDDERITEHCSEFGIQAIMTGEVCLNGTEQT